MSLDGFAAFRRIVLSAAFAGVITGLLMTVLQTYTVVPLILHAEQYEHSQPMATEGISQGAAHDHDAAHEHAALAPEGMQRTLYTAIATLLMAIGYGLLLGTCFAQMRSVGWRKGIALGFAAFLVFQLAPALGLPPVPPGVPSAELGPRQLWWLGTVLATGLGLASLDLAYRKRGNYWWLVGLILLVLPHSIGAPLPELGAGPVPPALARNFAIASVLVAAFFWLVLGAVQGYIFERFSREL